MRWKLPEEPPDEAIFFGGRTVDIATKMRPLSESARTVDALFAGISEEIRAN